MPVRNALKDSGPVPVKGAVHGADGVHAGSQKDLRVDIGEYFPYLGPYDRTKASAVLFGGSAVLEVTARYGAVPTRIIRNY